MPERLIGAVLKTVVPSRVPWVRIPLPPPFKVTRKSDFFSAFFLEMSAWALTQWVLPRPSFYWYLINKKWSPSLPPPFKVTRKSGFLICVLESMIWFVRVMWFIWENLLCEGIWEVGKIILTVHQTEPKRAFSKMYG